MDEKEKMNTPRTGEEKNRKEGTRQKIEIETPDEKPEKEPEAEKPDEKAENREKIEIDPEKTMEGLSNRLTDATKKLEEAEKLARETKEAHIRTLAEYDNYRKRTAKEKADSYTNGLVSRVTGILPVIDALEMALAAPTTDENFKKGVEMTLNTAYRALKNLGVEEIEAVGKPFDPNLHNAVLQREDPDKEPGTVTRRLQKGYRIGDRIIRHAAVAVSK